MTPTFYTLGHSNRRIEAFIGLLEDSGVRGVADVRAFAHSRAMPQFEGEALGAALAASGRAYRHFPALGGRRSRSVGVAPEANAWWENRSFHNYADYALQPAFRAGLEELRQLGQRERCAVMCSEAVWWRCHRRIIADHLLATGETVRHIMADRIEDAKLTPGAQVHADGTVTYPATAAR